MELPKLINNINERVIDDLRLRLSAKSKVSIAAASFSIYGSPDKPGGLSIQLCKSEKKEFYIRYSS